MGERRDRAPRGYGIGGHQSGRADSAVWLTPPRILDALGPFDLDPAAADPRPWPTAAWHIAPPEDGLTADWGAARVWLNPPYSRDAGRWLSKLADHGTGTALVFARTETTSFVSQVWERAHSLLFLHGRLHFYLPDGTRARGNAGAPSVLVAYGAYDTARLLDFGLPGTVVPLRAAAEELAGLRRDIRRVLTDLGVTNPPPRIRAFLTERTP